MSGAKGKVTKVCHLCGHHLTFHASTWEKMEWANGKRYPALHRGCGGEFIPRVSVLREEW